MGFTRRVSDVRVRKRPGQNLAWPPGGTEHVISGLDIGQGTYVVYSAGVECISGLGGNKSRQHACTLTDCGHAQATCLSRPTGTGLRPTHTPSQFGCTAVRNFKVGLTPPHPLPGHNYVKARTNCKFTVILSGEVEREKKQERKEDLTQISPPPHLSPPLSKCLGFIHEKKNQRYFQNRKL